MRFMSLLEIFKVPTYNDPNELSYGEVDFDYKKCTKCGLCVKVCPGDALALEDKKPVMRKAPDNQCFFCGCCSAICPAEAVIMKKQLICTNFYKPIENGELKPPRL